MIGRLKVIIDGTIEVSVTGGQGQVQEQVQIERGLDVLNAKIMIILHKTAQQHKQTEVEQIQQMFNMDEDQTLLQMPLIDVDQVRQSISPVEARDNLNL